MIRIEGEDEIRKELTRQKNEKANLLLMAAIAVLFLTLFGIAMMIRDNDFHILKPFGLLIALTLYIRSRNMRKRSIYPQKHDRIKEGKFKQP